MPSGYHGSNPPKDFICEKCGKKFEKVVYPSQPIPRFCSVRCRNIHVNPYISGSIALKRPRVGEKTCPVCGKIGRRNGLFCVEHRPQGILWTSDRDIILRKLYSKNGAMKTAEIMGLNYKQVLSRAGVLGLALDSESFRKIVHGAAAEHMTNNNPMKIESVKKKVAKFWEDHPEEVEKRNIKLLEAQKRIAKDKPTKLEIALFGYLDTLGVEYESYFIVKPKFIVDARIGNVIIQADGDYWHGHPRFTNPTERQLKQKKRDRAQDIYLTTCGFRVVRIWESDMCLSAVMQALSIDPASMSQKSVARCTNDSANII